MWTEDDGLRTVARRQAVVTHPRTGETSWFNHAHLFHASTHTFAWRRGDVMVVDHVLSTHGREPFTGERRILVAMAGGGGVAA